MSQTLCYCPRVLGGFYMRMWSKAGFPDLHFPCERHEAIAGKPSMTTSGISAESPHSIGASPPKA